VNGLEFREVCVRRCGEQPAEFEVMIRDRQLGTFALHEEFLLELPQRQHADARWRAVSLLELKNAVLTEHQMTDSDFVVPANARLSPSPDLQRAPRCRIERIPVEGDSSHLDRLRESFLTERIRYKIVGGLDSRGRGAGHLTVAVSSWLGAGMCLRRAGFLTSSESKNLLVDSRTGWKVCLLQGRF